MPNTRESPLMPPAAADSSSSVAVMASVVILCLNAVATIYCAWGDPQNVAFALVSYAVLLALLFCIRIIEKRRDAEEETRGGGIKVAVWVLATMLNVGFTWRAAAMLPNALAAVAWALVAVFSLGSFWALLIYRPVGSDKMYGVRSYVELSVEEKV
ncbi:hypothetical protein HPP92_007453 [Vanilla planifolia]|uniref:Uncharacterized protein n=1 Tax=Vanilla planifolia TaxID=51239 RepID=A0A835RLU8_VANPL|nr:hypothetical protein HPP92_007453 [Vanilla planifolia]